MNEPQVVRRPARFARQTSAHLHNIHKWDTWAAITPVLSTDGLGAAVIVRGVVVAWFADFTEEAREWCTENHFAEWLVWRAKTPEIVPLTPEENAAVQRRAAELSKLFADMPEAPNVNVSRGAEDAPRSAAGNTSARPES